MEQLPTLEHITPEKLKENDSQQENNELSAEQKKFQERYERELKPLIEILKPDHVSFEDFEEYTLDTLYESVGKIQSGQGRVVEDPEKTLSEAEALLDYRLHAIIEDSEKKRSKDEFSTKAKAAYILSGNIYEGWKENRWSFRDDAREIGKYIKEIINQYAKQHDVESLQDVIVKIDNFQKTLKIDIDHYFFPDVVFDNFSSETKKQIWAGAMPEWIFDRYKNSFLEDETYKQFVPETFLKRDTISEILDKNQYYFRGQEPKQIIDFLAQYGLSPQQIKPEDKLILLKSVPTDRVEELFTENDVREILNKGMFIKPERLPPEYVDAFAEEIFAK